MRWARAGLPHTAIEVTPLSRSDSEDLLAAWFGDSTRLFPERLRALILERAGGNPLYLEEVVRALIAAGVLVRDGAGVALHRRRPRPRRCPPPCTGCCSRAWTGSTPWSDGSSRKRR